MTARVLSDHRNPTLGDLGRYPEDVEWCGNAWSRRRHALLRSGGRKWCGVLHGVNVALFSHTVVRPATGRSGYVFRAVVPVLYG